MGRKRRQREEDTSPTKQDHKLDKTSAKADLIRAKASKSLAVAAKRKWLVILIGIAIAAYYALKGGLGGGIFSTIKSKLGM